MRTSVDEWLGSHQNGQGMAKKRRAGRKRGAEAVKPTPVKKSTGRKKKPPKRKPR
jgi:hypothetical protein